MSVETVTYNYSMEGPAKVAYSCTAAYYLFLSLWQSHVLILLGE